MTDDLVTRLREGCIECGLIANYPACVAEAADEIERLRAEINRLTNWGEENRRESEAEITRLERLTL